MLTRFGTYCLGSKLRADASASLLHPREAKTLHRSYGLGQAGVQ